MTPLMVAGLLALFRVLPHLSPRGYKMEPFRRAYEAVQLGVPAFSFALNIALLLAGLGFAIPMGRLVAVSSGMLLALIGNFMGKLTPNF